MLVPVTHCFKLKQHIGSSYGYISNWIQALNFPSYYYISNFCCLVYYSYGVQSRSLLFFLNFVCQNFSFHQFTFVGFTILVCTVTFAHMCCSDRSLNFRTDEIECRLMYWDRCSIDFDQNGKIAMQSNNHSCTSWQISARFVMIATTFDRQLANPGSCYRYGVLCLDRCVCFSLISNDCISVLFITLQYLL